MPKKSMNDNYFHKVLKAFGCLNGCSRKKHFVVGISNVVEENTEDIVAVHQAQLNPPRSQKATNEIEESTTHHLEQKKTRCNVSSRLKKPPVTKSDDFLY